MFSHTLLFLRIYKLTSLTNSNHTRNKTIRYEHNTQDVNWFEKLITWQDLLFKDYCPFLSYEETQGKSCKNRHRIKMYLMMCLWWHVIFLSNTTEFNSLTLSVTNITEIFILLLWKTCITSFMIPLQKLLTSQIHTNF